MILAKEIETKSTKGNPFKHPKLFSEFDLI